MKIVIFFGLLTLSLFVFLYKPAPIEVIEIKAEILNIELERQMALRYLNDLRQNSGISPYSYSEILEKSATAHANYLITNNTTGHIEVTSKQDFTGEYPSNRAAKAHYNVSSIAENLTSNSLNYKRSIDDLFSAIYHRFGFLDFISDEIGIGIVQNSTDSNKNSFVYNMGLKELNRLCSGKGYHGNEVSAYKICADKTLHIEKRVFLRALNKEKKMSKKIVLYPYHNQVDVPPVFYNETPDPLANHDVSGFPISIQFNDYYHHKVNLLSLRLYKESEEEITNTLLMNSHNDPNKIFNSNQYALFPLERLEYNTKYKAIASYRIKRKVFTREWSFYTRKLKEPFSIVNTNNASITIKPHIKHTIYFKPIDTHDTIKNLKFPADVHVSFLDNNTIELTLTTDNTDNFKLQSDMKVVQIKVE